MQWVCPDYDIEGFCQFFNCREKMNIHFMKEQVSQCGIHLINANREDKENKSHLFIDTILVTLK